MTVKKSLGITFAILVLTLLFALPALAQGCGCEMPDPLLTEPATPTPTPFATLAPPPRHPGDLAFCLWTPEPDVETDKPVRPPTERPDKPVRPPVDGMTYCNFLTVVGSN